MAERSKKKKEKDEVEAEQAPAEEKSVEQLILDRKVGKYGVVPIISYWAKELRKMEIHRHLSQNEILELAMSEVLGGKVSEKDLLEKARLAAAAGGNGAEDSEKPRKK